MNDSSEDRMPPIPRERMTEAQRAAADALIAGPRKGVKGPVHSPAAQPRADGPAAARRRVPALPERAAGAPLGVRDAARRPPVDPAVRVGGARAAGDRRGHVAGDDRRAARRSSSGDDERRRGRGPRPGRRARPRAESVADALYAEGVRRLGEQGLLDLLGLVGYFTTISMVLNVARTPADAVEGVAPLPAIAAQASIAP